MNNNPLKQYFRRPAVYLKLPSGAKYYSEKVIDMPETGELPIYPMTALDDITMKTPDALFNGSAVVDVIKSCVPNIKDPWAINNLDLDAILIGIRSASGDSTMDLESECPACKDNSTYGIELVNILATLKSADYDTELQIDDLKVKFKPLNYKEINEAALAQFEAQRLLSSVEDIEKEEDKTKKLKEAVEKITQVTMEIMTKGIDYIETPTEKVNSKEFINDFLKHCDKVNFVKIRDHLADLRQASDIKPLKIRCVSCNHEYEQPFVINASDFFG